MNFSRTITKSWRQWLRIHPAGELFPPLGKQDLRTLAHDIKQHGLRQPVSVIKDVDGNPVLLDGINRLDIAYNLEISPREDGRLVVALFPRAPSAELALPGGGSLSADFGGFELTGGVVVPNRRLFEWVRSRPGESAALIRERMRAGTVWPLS